MRKQTLGTILSISLLLLPLEAYAQKEKRPSSIFVCGGSSSQSSLYILGAAVSNVINKYLGVTASPLTVQGSVGALNRLAKKEVDIAYFSTSSYDSIYPDDPAQLQKEFPVIYKERGNIRQMYAITYGAYHVIAKTGINSFADLKGKRFAYEAPGWFGKPKMWELLFEYYKLDRKKDIISMLEPQGMGDEGRLFKEGLVDATNKSSVFPIAAYTELFRDNPGKLHLLSLTEEAANYVVKELPYYLKIVMPAGTYPGQDKDVIAMGYQSVHIVRIEMPESFVYDIVKAYHEHLEEIKAFHPEYKRQLSLENSLRTILMPIHPGAKKFYREKGVWTEALERRDKELLAQLGAGK
jgi:TRAP transporter TAXI family solute receptor